MRVCLPLLLCPLYPRIYGVAAGGLRAKIFIKQNAAWLLEQELRQVRPREEIALGTATDPYQPVERGPRSPVAAGSAGQAAGLRIGLVTKSTLIERDIPLLQRVAEKNTAGAAPDDHHAQRGAGTSAGTAGARPDLRLRRLARLRQAVCDRHIVFAAAARHHGHRQGAGWDGEESEGRGASFFCAQPLFLKPCSKEIYLGFIREHFPALEPMYRKRFESEAFVSSAYRKRIEELVKAVCAKYSLGRRKDALLTRGG